MENRQTFTTDREILNLRLAERHGWEYCSGIWSHPATRYSRDALPNLLSGDWLDYFALEDLLMKCGWRLGFRDGVYVAYRPSDGKRICRIVRLEALALAYIHTPINGPAEPPDYPMRPAMPLPRWVGQPAYHETPYGFARPETP